MTATPSPAHERAETSWQTLLLHHAAAWGAVLCALAPWWHGWTINAGGREFPVRIWPGHLLIDAVEVAVLALAGLLAGGWWWWAAGWQRGITGIAGSLTWFATGAGAVMGWLTPDIVLIMVAALLLWGATAAVWFRRSRAQKLRAWFAERRSWNAIFFAGFVLLNTAGDVLMTGSAPPGWLAAAGFIGGRLLTQLIVACGLWCLLLLGERWWPRGAGWVGWGTVLFAPLIVITDMALRLMWTKSLHRLCGEIESRGRVDVLKIKEGVGVNMTALHEVLIVLFILSAPACFVLSRWVSRKRGFKISGARLGAVALSSWVLLMGLNVVESALKSRVWRNWESRVAPLQLTPFAPPPGVATFDVVAANPVATGPVAAQRHPEIFLFIVETLRADAIDPARTPCLARLRDEECQRLEDTRSASNSTYLSWFSILHGRLPYYFEEMHKVVAPAPLLALLRSAGYAIEVRSAGNFDYCEMITSNFGDGSLMRVMEHVPVGHPERVLESPERELRMMQRLQEAVANSPPGGVLWLTAIDSGHYPYKWGANWAPPFRDFEENPVFPVIPSPEEVERVRRRYWNSVAWGDHLLGGFVASLKARGRYDDAMIIVTGDHGEEFKEHGSWFHCSALNPEQTRVPILIKWPAAMGRGPALHDASHLDLLPSILDAAGVPESAWRAMPGRSLRRGGEATSICTSCYNSQDGETMVWHRDGWEAAFSWHAPWVLAAPKLMWLERLCGPDGPVECADPAAWETELRHRFPDAFGRVFTQCRLAGK